MTELRTPTLFYRKEFNDERGLLSAIYNSKELWGMGVKDDFVQANYIESKKDVLRGIHYQRHPYQQSKLVCVLEGEVKDVAVDLDTLTTTILDLRPGHLFYIPNNYAHGILTTSKSSKVLYFCSKTFSRSHCEGIMWNDPKLGIDWGIDHPILSEKDTKWKAL